MSTVDAVPTDKPPLILLNVAIFTLTGLVTLIAVPWYGIAHGFSGGTWAFFAFFLIANGMSITAGYHRLWAHRAYEAHLALRVFYLIFGTMALQNSVFVWASGHRTPPPECGRQSSRIRIRSGAASGSRTSAGCCATTRAASRISPTSRTCAATRCSAFQHRYLRAAGAGHQFRPAARWRAGSSATSWGTFCSPASCGWSSATTSPSSSIRWRTCGAAGPTRMRTRARDNPVLALLHLRRGLPQLPPHLRARLPQRRALVAVGSDQVADRRPAVRGADAAA